ncbi:kinase domain protein, partial [Opisthorchis viverrini]
VFELICKLGKGSYGSVFKARYKATGGIVAIKKVPVDSDLTDIVKEISIMQQCDSPFIVKCYGSLFDSQDLWICMEYCGAGSIADIMRLRGKALEEREIATVLQYSLRGLDYLHQVIQEIGYNYSADIWSLGITAIEMAEGKPPLADIHPMRALFMIPSQPPPALRKPSSWSAEFRTFVTSCLSKTPESRPTAAALLQTEFIRHAQSCSILLPLIEESNAAREKRLSDSKAAILSGITHEANQAHTPGEKRTSMDASTAAAAEGIDDGNGTMVRQDVSLPSAQMDHGFDGNLTLVSSDSVEVVRRTGTSGSQHSRRILSHSGNEDDPATMVIKRSDDEAGGEPQDEDEDDSGSVIVHNTNGSIDMDGRDSERHKAFEMLDAAMRPTTTVEGTLTRRAKADGVPRASVSNVQDFPNYGGAAPPVANVAARPSVPQRPFAPFSRALQHNGLFPGGLVHEPGALNRLSYAELQRLLNTLTVDLETELRNLAIRYRHKRQPLLDAIAEKTAQATEMKLMEAGHP